MSAEFDLQEDRVLGEGVLGTLYQGRERSTRRNVSITVLRDEFSRDVEFGRRFHRDLAIAVQVVHPNVVRTYGSGVWKEKLFYATERVEARTLSEHLRREKRLSTGEVCRVAEAGGESVLAAEKGGITPLHPRTSGFFLTADGTVKNSDLWLPRTFDREADFRRFVPGALAYFSPERIRGEVTDVRSDVFALGVVLYELATGRLPFDGHESPTSFAYQVLHATPPPLSRFVPTLPRELEAVILRCLAKSPRDRFQSAGEFLKEFRAARQASMAAAGAMAPGPDGSEDFEIHEEQVLGEGGMGTLYRGHQRSVNREVAIKVIQTQLTGNADICSRFRYEAKLMAQVHDGHVVQVFGAGTWKGRLFYAMELVEGQDLSARLVAGPPPTLEEVLAVAEGVAKALRAVWKYRIVHRDLKPANIFLGKNGTVKVTDFGLATIVKRRQAESQFIVGTLAYVSPEQGIGADVDVRSDIYSLGVVLFELASGELPFECKGSSTSVLRRHRYAPTPSLMATGKVPGYIDAIIQRCLAKKPGQRFQTPDELIEKVQSARQRLWIESHPGGAYGRRRDDSRSEGEAGRPLSAP